LSERSDEWDRPYGWCCSSRASDGKRPDPRQRLLTEMDAWSVVFLDEKPIVVGNIADLTAQQAKLGSRAQRVRKRPKLGRSFCARWRKGANRKEEFCAAIFARLAQWARQAGAGTTFSLATVFACQEYESWCWPVPTVLRPASGGRASGTSAGYDGPEGDLERAPRDAKGGSIGTSRRLQADARPAPRDGFDGGPLDAYGRERCDRSSVWRKR